MRTVALLNQKGGVAKTTTAYALSKGLEGNVLAVDADPQTNLTFAFGISPKHTLQNVFDGMQASEAITDNLLAGDLSLSDADMRYTNVNRAYILKEALEPIKGDYDYCIIDCPPVLGVLTMNALTVADEVIIPISSDAFSLQGVTQLHDFILNIRKYCNPDLRIAGILRTKYNARLNLSKVLDDEIKQAAERLDTKLFDTCISESVAVRECFVMQQNFLTEAPTAQAVKDYKDFIAEYIGG